VSVSHNAHDRPMSHAECNPELYTQVQCYLNKRTFIVISARKQIQPCFYIQPSSWNALSGSKRAENIAKIKILFWQRFILFVCIIRLYYNTWCKKHKK